MICLYSLTILLFNRILLISFDNFWYGNLFDDFLGHDFFNILSDMLHSIVIYHFYFFRNHLDLFLLYIFHHFPCFRHSLDIRVVFVFNFGSLDRIVDRVGPN